MGLAAENAGALVSGCSGGENVIDEDDIGVADLFEVSLFDFEGPLEI